MSRIDAARAATSDEQALYASLIVEDGTPLGRWLTDDQLGADFAVLDDGRPRRHFETAPRGYAKTQRLGALGLTLVAAVLPAGAQAFAAAVDQDQARLVARELHGFIQRTPAVLLAGNPVRVESNRVVAANGAELVVLAADAASAYGLRPAALLLDELSMFPETTSGLGFFRALWSATVKDRRTRVAVRTSPGDPSHFSAALLDQARADPKRWRVSEVRGPLPWIDPDDLEEQERTLPVSVYRQLHLGLWATAEDRLSRADVLACVDHRPRPLPYDSTVSGYLVTVDVGLVRDRTAVAVCHAERDAAGLPSVVVDSLEVWQGNREHPVSLSAVEEHVEAVAKQYHARVHYDPSQFQGSAQRLAGRGVRCTQWNFSAQSVGRLGSALLVAMHGHRLSLPNDEALIDELLRVRLRPTGVPGAYRLATSSTDHDDRAVVIGLAVLLLTERAPAQGRISRPGAQSVVGRSSVESIERIAELERTGQTVSPWLSQITRRN